VDIHSLQRGSTRGLNPPTYSHVTFLAHFSIPVVEKHKKEASHSHSYYNITFSLFRITQNLSTSILTIVSTRRGLATSSLDSKKLVRPQKTIMPQNTATPASSSVDLEDGNLGSFSQSTTDSRASAPTDTAATPIDTAATPTDTAATPTDTAAKPTNKAATPTDTAAIPTDTTAQSFLLGFPVPKSNIAKRRGKKLEPNLKE
jgi:hypothetical protein